MATNLFIAYDLIYPGQNYDRVRDKIRTLGRWYQFQYSLFYVSSNFTTQQAHDQIRAVMDMNDRLVVVEAANGFVSYYPGPHVDALNIVWFSP